MAGVAPLYLNLAGGVAAACVAVTAATYTMLQAPDTAKAVTFVALPTALTSFVAIAGACLVIAAWSSTSSSSCNACRPVVTAISASLLATLDDSASANDGDSIVLLPAGGATPATGREASQHDLLFTGLDDAPNTAPASSRQRAPSRAGRRQPPIREQPVAAFALDDL
jgi:hypothetical protein